MSLGRRDFLAVTGSAVVGLIGGSPWSGGDGARARAPVSNSQVPGFYRFGLGQFQLTVVSDGTLAFPAEVVWPEAPKAERDAVLASDFQPTDKSTFQVNVLAVNTGDRLVLIDAGSRGRMQPTAGRLLQNLAAAEIKPEEVDTVLITHAHPDHLWGVTNASDTERTFPNAEYVIGESELNFWMQSQHPLESHAVWGDVYRQNMKTIAAIKDRIRTVKPEGEVVPGIAAIATPGHTPGHTSLQIASGSNQLLCTADVVGSRAVSFGHPDWRGQFDLDVDQGAKTRRAFLDRCASEKVTVSSYHLPFPGIGNVVRTGTAFNWLPSDWRWEGVSPT